MSRHAAIIAFSLFILTACGCSRRVECTIRNGKDQSLQDVTFRIDSIGFTFCHGIIPPHAHASYSGGAKLPAQFDCTAVPQELR